MGGDRAADSAPATGGRPPLWTQRDILNAIFYVLRGGIGWRLLPTDMPPRSTAFGWFSRWRDEGLFARLNHALVMTDRQLDTRINWIGHVALRGVTPRLALLRV